MNALILAAYGSSGSDRISSGVRKIARAVAGRGQFDEVVAAFHKEPPYFSEVLSTVESDRVTVVPLLTSAGYTLNTILPQEMGLTGRVTQCEGRTVRVTDPLGVHPQVPDLLARIARQAMERHALSADQTAVVLAGHGTLSDPQSGAVTRQHAATLRQGDEFGDVLAVFLNEPPDVREAFELTRLTNLLVIPYLLGGSIHATRDIPERLSVSVDGRYPPEPCLVRGRRIVFTRTPFEDVSVANMVLDLARATEEEPA